MYIIANNAVVIPITKYVILRKQCAIEGRNRKKNPIELMIKLEARIVDCPFWLAREFSNGS